MISLLYLKHAFNESDESLCERWAESVPWQFFSGQTYYEPRMPCDPTHIGRFRKMIGEEGVEQLLIATIEAAVSANAIKPSEFEKVIVDSTVMEKAIAHPTDSRLLEIARYQVVKTAKAAGITLKQTYAKEALHLRRKAGGYAHARQFKRLRKVVKRQRTVLGIVLREIQRKRSESPAQSSALQRLAVVMQRAERLRTQKPKDKDKLYAFHAPEVSCCYRLGYTGQRHARKRHAGDQHQGQGRCPDGSNQLEEAQDPQAHQRLHGRDNPSALRLSNQGNLLFDPWVNPTGVVQLYRPHAIRGRDIVNSDTHRSDLGALKI
jgi:hypothetical protein